jgi:hypothetical protein
MPRHSGNFFGSSIHIDGVIAALAQKFTPVTLQMSNKVNPLHDLPPRVFGG